MPDGLEVMEITDLTPPNGSVDFGGGAELLMNRKSSESSSDKKQSSDIISLENDLNELSSTIYTPKSPRNVEFTAPDISQSTPPIPVSIQPPEVDIGKSMTMNEPNSNVDDIFNNTTIPADIEVPVKVVEQTPEEKLRDKLIALRKLEELESKGVKLSKHYTMDSSIAEMKGEYEVHIANKERSNSVKFQGKMLMMAITGIEYLNNKIDPFDVKLDGWGEQINENIDEYDEIFGELHEKYGQKTKMAPELKLLFQLAGSGIMIHMTNTMFKSAMPGIDDIMKQHPDLARQFTSAAVNTMGGSNPGFSDFMNDITGNNPPPPSMSTSSKHSTRDQGASQNTGQNNDADGIDISEPFAEYGKDDKPRNVSRTMKGPSDIDDIMAGLKSKVPDSGNDANGSTISLQDLADMNNASVPSRRKRKTKSDKSISLAI
jgi:hypothetical protein